MHRSYVVLAAATSVLLAGCGASGSSSAEGSSSSAASVSAPATVPAEVADALSAVLHVAPPSAGTPAGPAQVLDAAAYRSQAQEPARGLVAAATMSVMFPGHVEGVQVVMRFADAAGAAADARSDAAAALDQGSKQAFSDPAIPGAAGYDHVLNGQVVSRDLFFNVGADEIRLACASDGLGHPTRRALIRAAEAWYRAARSLPVPSS